MFFPFAQRLAFAYTYLQQEKRLMEKMGGNMPLVRDGGEDMRSPHSLQPGEIWMGKAGGCMGVMDGAGPGVDGEEGRKWKGWRGAV